MATIATKMTVAEYGKIPPPPGGRWELRHGELAQVTFASGEHYKIQNRLRDILSPVVGKWGFVGIEMAFRPLPEHEVWSADVGILALERWKTFPKRGWLMGSPEVVIEVLSPSNTASEMLDREETCMAGGCLEFWTVDTDRRKVRVSRRDDTAHIYKDGDSIPLPLFGDAAAILISEIFGE